MTTNGRFCTSCYYWFIVFQSRIWWSVIGNFCELKYYELKWMKLVMMIVLCFDSVLATTRMPMSCSCCRRFTRRWILRSGRCSLGKRSFRPVRLSHSCLSNSLVVSAGPGRFRKKWFPAGCENSICKTRDTSPSSHQVSVHHLRSPHI